MTHQEVQHLDRRADMARKPGNRMLVEKDRRAEPEAAQRQVFLQAGRPHDPCRYEHRYR